MEYCLPVFVLLIMAVLSPILAQQTQGLSVCSLWQPGGWGSGAGPVVDCQCLDFRAKLATLGGCLVTIGILGHNFFISGSSCNVPISEFIHFWNGGFAGLYVTTMQDLQRLKYPTQREICNSYPDCASCRELGHLGKTLKFTRRLRRSRDTGLGCEGL